MNDEANIRGRKDVRLLKFYSCIFSFFYQFFFCKINFAGLRGPLAYLPIFAQRTVILLTKSYKSSYKDTTVR